MAWEPPYSAAPGHLPGSTLPALSGWAFVGRWFYRTVGEVGLHVAIAAMFLGLSGAWLHPLIPGPRAYRRFQIAFLPAFLAYAVGWSAAWFLWRNKTGEWIGSALGCLLFRRHRLHPAGASPGSDGELSGPGRNALRRVLPWRRVREVADRPFLDRNLPGALKVPDRHPCKAELGTLLRTWLRGQPGVYVRPGHSIDAATGLLSAVEPGERSSNRRWRR